MKRCFEAEAREHFSKKQYKMTIELDHGVHRSIKFMHENSHNGYFRINTWPGHLCYSGDMGTFVFSRIDDMVYFFNGDGINPSYWSEKLQAGAGLGKQFEEFDIDVFMSRMNEEMSSAIENFPDNSDGISEQFDGLQYVSDEHEAIEFVRNLNCPGFEICDFSWPTRFTYHYLYACIAINWACKHYLGAKQVADMGQQK